jgi:hypothetical protein
MGDLLAPWHLIVLAALLAIILIPVVMFLLTVQRVLNKCAPAARTMEPGLVWLFLVPFLGLIWSFFLVMGVAKSLANEFRNRGISTSDPLPGQSIGIAMSVCNCCCFIPLLGALASLAGLVLWIVYWVKIAEFSRMLDGPQYLAPVTPAP